MRLVLHIIRKDLRRQWLEILGYCVAVAAWASRLVHPAAYEWLRTRDLLPMLMFGLWLLVTVRAVQGESLVGDREWWPTRPYRWGQLLAAKALLLVMVLNGPLLVAQLYLFINAGIPLRWSLVPGLIVLQGMFVLFLTLPAAALASVTASVVQWVMSVVGVILAITVVTWLPWGKLPTTLPGQENISMWLVILVLLPFMTAALFWQYARRRAYPARIVLVAALASIPLCILFASSAQARRMAYPYAVSFGSMQLEIKPAESGVREFDFLGNEDEIRIPLVDAALGSEAAIQIEGYRLQLAGPGWHWESEWRNSAHNLAFFDPVFNLDERLPQWVQKQVKQGHTTAQVELAWESYRFNPPVRARASAPSFAVPGIGYCRTEPSSEARRFEISSGPDCVTPLSLPPIYLIAIDPDENRCMTPNSEPEVPAGHTAYGLEFGSSGPAYLDPNPVRRFSLQAGDWLPPLPQKPGEVEYRSASVCPRGSFTIRTGQLLGRQSATFDLGDIGVEKNHPAGEATEDVPLKFSPANE